MAKRRKEIPVSERTVILKGLRKWKKTLPVGGIKYGIRWVMLQIGSCCNNHLIINVIFKRLGVKAGKDSLPFAIFVTQNKENEYTRTLRHIMLQIGSEKLKFSTPNKSFIKWLTNFALAGWLYVRFTKTLQRIQNIL